MQIGDIAYDKSIDVVVLIVGVTEDPRNPDDPVYTVVSLDQSLDWRYFATLDILEAL